MISECSMFCQRIKYQREPNWEDAVDHHLYSLDPLTSLSVYTLGPLKEEELGNRFIIVIVDNFSKLVGQNPARNRTSKEFIHALLQWVSNSGVPIEIRIDGGSQLSSQLSSNFSSLLGYYQLVIVTYHVQSNGLVERQIKSR